MRYDLAAIENLHPDLAVLIETWRDGSREWLENLEVSPSVEAIVWQPYKDGPSIGGILLHMIGCDMHWLEEFAYGRDISPDHPAVAYDLVAKQDIPYWPTPPAKEWAWYLDLYQSERESAIAKIMAFNQPDQVFARSTTQYTFRWIIAHLVEHDSYHGGQIILLHEMWKKLQA